MSCTEVQTILERFLSGKLGGAESRQIRRHLASCARCAARLSRVDRIEILPVLDQEIEPSEDFRARFLARLESHRAQQAAGGPARRVFRFQDSWRALFGSWAPGKQLAAAGALAAFIAFGIYVAMDQDRQPPPAGIAGDIAIAENLPLLQDMKVIENLELLEDFDAIENLSNGGKTPSTVQ